MKLIEDLTRYTPYNDQERHDQKEILGYLKKGLSVFYREDRIAHMTASAWVVNNNRTKVLMVHHNLYKSWSWMGGHADGHTNLQKVAYQEVLEESGLKAIRPVHKNIFSIEICTVDGHEKKGLYVPSHLHLNITYLFEADETAPLSIKPDENSGVAWFTLEEGIEASTEPWFRQRIYTKLNEKLKKLSQ